MATGDPGRHPLYTGRDSHDSRYRVCLHVGCLCRPNCADNPQRSIGRGCLHRPTVVFRLALLHRRHGVLEGRDALLASARSNEMARPVTERVIQSLHSLTDHGDPRRSRSVSGPQGCSEWSRSALHTGSSLRSWPCIAMRCVLSTYLKLAGYDSGIYSLGTNVWSLVRKLPAPQANQVSQVAPMTQVVV